MTGLLLAILLTQTPAPAAAPPQKGHYTAIELVRVDVKEGVEFPADYLITMTEELATQLTGTKKFTAVLREGEKPAAEGTPTLLLVGTVTHFDKGSRAARYLVGFGAGQTKVAAHIKVLDRATEAVLFEDDVDGKVVMGVAGGDSIGATRGLAKEVAKVVRNRFF